MLRSGSAILGIGLVILWIAGLNGINSPAWLTWLDAAAAVWAFVIAAGAPTSSNAGGRIGNTVSLSIGLFALWIAGLLTTGPFWQDWWNFAFACAYLVLGVASGMMGRRSVPASQSPANRDEERFRHTA